LRKNPERKRKKGGDREDGGGVGRTPVQVGGSGVEGNTLLLGLDGAGGQRKKKGIHRRGVGGGNGVKMELQATELADSVGSKRPNKKKIRKKHGEIVAVENELC